MYRESLTPRLLLADEIPIGSPAETKPSMQGYQTSPHIYMRHYSNGVAVVNSDKSASHTVQLSEPMFAATPSSGGGEIPDDTCATPSCGIPQSWAVDYGAAETRSVSLAPMSGAVLVRLAPEPSPALSCPEKVEASSPGLFCDTRVKGAYVLCPAAERYFCPSGQACNQTDPAGVVDCHAESPSAADPVLPIPAPILPGDESIADAGSATRAECASVSPATPALVCVADDGGGASFQVCPNGTQVSCGAAFVGAKCWPGAPRRVLCGAAQPSFPMPRLPGIPKNSGQTINVSDPRVILWNGRWAASSLGAHPEWTNGMMCGWPGCSVNFTFRGTGTAAVQASGCKQVNVVVDGAAQGYFSEYPQVPIPFVTVAANVSATAPHTVTLQSRGEYPGASCNVFAIQLGAGGQLLPPPQPKPRRRIVCVGDSISCGFGNECGDGSPSTQNAAESYCPMLGRLFDADVHIIAKSGMGMLKNYNDKVIPTHPNMPDLWNRTLCGSAQPAWPSSSWVPDLAIGNLGTNDYSTQPNPTADQFHDGYLAFSKRLKSLFPGAKQVFMSGPMWCCHVCKTCCETVHSVANEVGAAVVDMACLDYSKPGLVGCAGHPSVAGHQKMVNDTAPAIRHLMGW